jgi:hypothetical protein
MKQNKYFNKIIYFYKKYQAKRKIKLLLAECGMWRRNKNYYAMSKILRLIYFLENKYILGERKYTGEDYKYVFYYRDYPEKWNEFKL